MANRDQGWGFRGRRDEQERWRRDEDQRRAGQDRARDGRGDESRSFDERPGGPRWEGGEPWRGEARYGARYDQDRAGGGYGGQEYGMEGGRGHAMDAGRNRPDDREERETWRPDRGEPYGDLELNPRNRGVQEFGPPSDYAYHPQAGHEFDPDYLHWREEQMRSHDRDYHEWRRNQRDSYDEDYRRFRTERREHFGRTFQDWRAQRNTTGGVRSVTVMPGEGGPSGGGGGYGADAALPGGYADRRDDKPSGMLEPPEAMNASAGAGQTGVSPTPRKRRQSSTRRTQAKGRSTSPEFGKEPPQVQAASGAVADDRKDERR